MMSRLPLAIITRHFSVWHQRVIAACQKYSSRLPACSRATSAHHVLSPTLFSHVYVRLLQCSNVVSNCTSTSEHNDLNKLLAKQQSVKVLLDLYVSARGTAREIDPLLILDAITKSTQKSAKQSLLLLNDPPLTNSYDVSLLKDITEDIDKHRDSPQVLTSMAWALATLDTKQKLFFRKTDLDIYPTQSTLVHECLLTEYGKKLFNQIEGIVLKQGLSHLQRTEIVRTLWAFVQTQQGSVELFTEIKNRILTEEATLFGSNEIAQIVWCFSKLKSVFECSDVFKKMTNAVLQGKLVAFRTNEIPVILVSYVDAGQGSLDFYKRFKNDILNRDIRAFTPSELCQILWSFSKVKMKQFDLSDLLGQLENEILRRGVKGFDDHGMAVLLWSFLELNWFSKNLLTLLRNVIGKRYSKSFSPDDISIYLRSFAKVKRSINSHQTFAKIDKELVRRGLSAFNNGHLATTMWALAETGHGSHALFVLLKKEIHTRNIADLTGAELSQIAWSLAKARAKLNMTDFFEQLSAEIVNNYDLSRLTLRQLALIAWSFAVTNVVPSQLFTAFKREISKRDIDDISNSVLCQILYSFAVGKDAISLGNLLKPIERRIMNGASSLDNRQLTLVVWCSAEIIDVSSPMEIFEVLIKEVGHRAIQEFMPADICRILWGLAKVKPVVNTFMVFNSLRIELLRRGLAAFTVAQVTMATVALTEANEWYKDVFNLFKNEIISCNSQHYDGIHLCSLARSFSDIKLETNELFHWLVEEMIHRNVSTFPPKELIMILQFGIKGNNLGQQFLKTVDNQLMDSELKGYDQESVEEVCSLLQSAGVNTDLLLKATQLFV